MDIICLSALLMLSTGITRAQHNDTIKPQQLKEVTVKANPNITDAIGTYYIPSARQKESSQNGIDLLRRMSIPQIKIGLADDNVTTNTGSSVSIYINYVKASTEELNGLKTTDVRKVEYFQSPSDQRFMGERNVINIILQPYQYGGYTKASLGEKLFIGLSNTAYIYSKFSYRKLTYDIYAGSINLNNHHNNIYNEGRYFISSDNNSGQWIKRIQQSEYSRFTQNTYPVSLRQSYSTQKLGMKNTVAFTFQETPQNSNNGLIKHSIENQNSIPYSSISSSQSKTLSYNGYFNFNLHKEFYLTITPTATYNHNNQYYHHSSDKSDITNNASENNHSISIIAMGRKTIGAAHYLFLRGFAGLTNYQVNYSGTTESSDEITEQYGGATFQYGYYTNNLSADMLLGIRCERNKTNSVIIKEIYPFLNANFGWSPNKKHSLNLALSYSREPMGTNVKSPNILQENEFMYYCGNPSLEYSPNIMVNLSYNWLPDSRFQISPFAQYYCTFNRYVPIYIAYPEANAILRRYENNGNHYRAQWGIAFTAKFLDGNLQFQLMPSQFHYKSTGYYKIGYNPFALSCSAIYYLKKFYFSGYYEMKNRTLWTNSGTIYKDKSQLQFSAGWNNSNLNIRLGIANPFRSSWACATKEFATPFYQERQTVYGTSAHFNLNLSVTYIIGYGKKVSHNNEIGSQSNSKSAILLR